MCRGMCRSRMKKRNILRTVTRTTTIRIEVAKPGNFAAALCGYWAERDTMATGEEGFLIHLSLMAEQGFIPDSVEKFGIIARIEKDAVRIVK